MLSKRPRQYQPTVTRLPFLLLLFTFTLALIALTELACRRLPPRNSGAFAVLDLKGSLDKRASILARDAIEDPPTISNADSAAADPPAFLPLEPSLGVSAPSSIIPPATASVFLALQPSIDVLAPTSVGVVAQSSVGVPAKASGDGSVQASIDLHLQTSIEVPTQPSIGVPVETSISDPIPASPRTTDDQDATAAGSVYLSLGTPASATSVPGSDYLPLGPIATVSPGPSPSEFLPLDSSSTDSSAILPGSPAPSVYLPLGPTTASESVDATPKEFHYSVATSEYLPLGSQSVYLDAGSSVYLPLHPTKPAGFDHSVFGDDSSDPSLPSTPTYYSTPDDSVFLPLGGPTATQSTPDESAYLPSASLPLGPTATYSTPDDSAYLPLDPTSAYLPLDPTSAYLPLAPTVTYSTPDDSVFLPLAPTATYSTPDDSAYLPLDPTSAFLPPAPTSAYLPLAPTVTYSTPDDSVFLPLAPTATYSTPDDSAYLPLDPTSAFLPPAPTSAYLPLAPTATYSTPDDSAYLPLDPTTTYHLALPESEFLPLGPSIPPSTSRDIEPYIRPSLYLPIGPAESTGTDNPVLSGHETDYLPLSPIATALPSSDYLPLDPIVSGDPLAFQPESEYLPVAPKPKSQLYLPVSNYLPIGPVDGSATAGPTPYVSKPSIVAAPAETAYLPLESAYIPLKSSNPQIENSDAPAPLPAASAFLPLVPLPSAGESAYLPLTAGVPEHSAYLPLPQANPKEQNNAQDIRTQDALPLAIDPSGAIPLPNLSPNQPMKTANPEPVGAQNSAAYVPGQYYTAGELINPPAPTGVFEGESYSMGANGVVVLGGKTFDRSSPTTAVLDNGKTIAVDSNGIAVFGAKDAKTFALPPAPTGVFEGESYSMGANGAIVIGGKTFDRSSPTTAVLDNGKTIAVDSNGIAVLGAKDAKTFALPSASSGVFEGETYSVGANGAIVIGGKTFDRSSPTTAVLGNGKTVEVGPSGIAIFGAEDARLPFKTFAQPPARTGMFDGEVYSIGSNGVVIIGGKTFDRSSPTTAVLRNGKTVEVGPNGIAIFGAKNAQLQSKTFAEPPARTGVFEGEAYSIGSNGIVIIGGKTFDGSSPTTAVLSNGKTVKVSPSGIAILPADDGSFHTTALPEHAKAYATTTGILGGERYSVGTDGKLLIGGKTFDLSSPTTAILDNGKTVEIGPTGVALVSAKDSGSGPVKHYIAPDQYVLGAFVPVIVAVIFTIPWQILNAAVKEIEPFYQLQREDGATAADSLALEYRSSINIIATITAIRKGHFLVWWSGLISIVAVALAPLATETVFIGFQGHCTPQSGRQACVPQLNVYPVAARVLQGLLSFIALMTLALAYSLHRGKTGLRANALSIAGLAALFQNHEVVEDFRRLNPHYTTSKMVSSALRNNRYRIAAFFEEDGTSAYGLIKCNHDSALMDPNYRTAFRRGKKYATVNVTATEDHERPKKHRTFSSYFTHSATIVVYAAFIAGLEALVIYYNQTGGDTGFERWMDSQTFGVAFLFTALGVLIKLFWTHLDDDMRNMEPYRRLLTGAVKASDSILLAPHSNPFSGLIYSLHKRHFFNAYISLVAILCLPLIVALASIPFKAGLTFIAYRTSTYISIGVLSMMLIGIVWLLCRRKTPDLVRRPDTIASVLLFICGSSMREDFKGMSLMRREEREQAVTKWGKSYAMGNVIGVDGVERQAIDESVFVTAEMK